VTPFINLIFFIKLNSDQISWDAEHSIDSVFKKLIYPRSMYYIDITGYSDNVGTRLSNIRLSDSRAEKVAKYFEKYHFIPNRIKYHGAFNSLAKDNQDKKENPRQRKVHVKMYIKPAQNKFFPRFLEEFERYSLPVDLGGNIKTQSHTKLLIPSDAFIDQFGNEITSDITIMYREYRDTLDFLLRGIPMNNSNSSGIYNSTGMFEILAFSGRTQVFLKPQKSIGIIFGLNKRLPRIDLYFYNDSLRHWVFENISQIRKVKLI